MMSQVLVARKQPQELELLINLANDGPLTPVDNVKSDENDSISNSSVDTNEAFMEMLGLQDPLTDAIDEEPDKPTTFCKHIALPKRCSRYLRPDCTAFYVDDLLSKQECQHLIHLATKTPSPGFRYITEATHKARDGTTFSVQLQNPNPHKLVVFDNPTTISKLWTLIKDKLSDVSFNCGPPLGLNPKLRVLRYDACDNDRFEAHFDATTVVGNTKSLLTVLIYLNDGDGIEFEGGETLYLDHHVSGKQNNTIPTKVTPRAGKVVIFEHDLYHSGAPLTWGTKYVLRTDVMFENRNEENKGEASGCSNLDKANDQSVRDQDGQEKSHVSTMYTLCQELSLSENDMQLLRDMELLQITVESLLSPGITILKRMLNDSGMDVGTVDKLVHSAVSHCQDG